jgi:hypothetical protein
VLARVIEAVYKCKRWVVISVSKSMSLEQTEVKHVIRLAELVSSVQDSVLFRNYSCNESYSKLSPLTRL